MMWENMSIVTEGADYAPYIQGLRLSGCFCRGIRFRSGDGAALYESKCAASTVRMAKANLQ